MKMSLLNHFAKSGLHYQTLLADVFQHPPPLPLEPNYFGGDYIQIRAEY